MPHRLGKSIFTVVRRSQATLLTDMLKSMFKPKDIAPIVLFDGAGLNDSWADDWECTSDKVFGGPSKSDLYFEVPKDGTFPFLRFMGSMDMSRKKAQELNVSGGFCAIRHDRGDFDSAEDLDDYEGVELVYRSAVRTPCLVNITLENRTAEDVYQTKLILSPSESWIKMHIPFSSLRLTLIGKDRMAQGSFSGSNIESFGLLLKHHEGPFCIDIHSITILNKLDSEFMVQSVYERPNFHRLVSPTKFTLGEDNK